MGMVHSYYNSDFFCRMAKSYVDDTRLSFSTIWSVLDLDCIIVLCSLVVDAIGHGNSTTCTRDTDCLLNGLCIGGTCACDAPWTGDTCGELDVLPAQPGGAYGYKPNVTSWGGNFVFYDGKYHLYVSEMVGGCGLNYWTHNSQVVHATSPTPQGPYIKQDVALLPWAHNPQVVTDTQNSTTTFYLFHIGAGDNTSQTVTCPPNPPQPDRATVIGMSSMFRTDIPPAPPANGALYHAATNPSGPWTPHELPFGCNNPAPCLLANGTWFILCNSGGYPLYSSPSIEGPWKQVASLGNAPSHDGTWEDPFLYQDKRGNFHAIFHAYNATTPCGVCDSALVSGHMYSQDGIAWSKTTIQPYTHSVKFTDGSSHTFATRERPKLYIDPNTRVPTYLMNGVNPHTTCPPNPSCRCKVTLGIDWDFTLIQPLNVF
eukprot:m.204046 g.204046  ORF g.204046 m.204046 type:complete len:428 (+) comp15005_c0_seq2:148-1431(+)